MRKKRKKGCDLEGKISRELFHGNFTAEDNENKLFIKLKNSLSKNKFISKKTNLLMKETHNQRWEVCLVYDKIQNRTNSIIRKWFIEEIYRTADKGRKKQILYLCLQLIPFACMIIGGIISICVSVYRSRKNKPENENKTIEELSNDELLQHTELMSPEKNKNNDQNEEYLLNDTMDSKTSTIQE